MQSILSTAGTVLVLALGAAVPAQARGAGQPVPAPLLEQIPELGNQSSWAQDTSYEGPEPDKSRRGVYPVGNGHVFGYLGLGARANTIQALTGPRYQTDEAFAPRGHFGELTLEVGCGGTVLELPEQRLRRVRGANFVISEDRDAVLTLRTLTFAPPGARHLTRVITLTNQGPAPLTDLWLRAAPERQGVPVDAALALTYDSPQRPARAVFRLGGGRVDGATLRADVGTLGAGTTWTTVLTVSTAALPDAPLTDAPLTDAPPTDAPPTGSFAGVPPDLERATADARATLTWWQQKLADTLYFDTDHEKLRDLVADWKVLMLVQRCAESGAVSPMINHRGAWVRDSNGPLLAFLRFGMHAEARSILEYLFRATCLLGRVPDHVPLDLDFAGLDPRTTDWAELEVPDSEVPSWVILQHFWYWRATRDTALLRRHWPLLDACLKKQRRGADSLMTFHGDEAWLHGALYSLFPERVPTPCLFIAEDRGRDRRTWSFASGVQFLIALHAFGEMVDGLDRDLQPERWEVEPPEPKPSQRYLTRAYSIMTDIEERYWLEPEQRFAPAISPVTGEPHRLPVANANLLPIWVGWIFPSGEKSKQNLRHTLAGLWRRGARVGSTATVGHCTGHLQGILLTALAEHNGQQRLDCLDEVLRLAEPAGEWGELYDPEGRPIPSDDPRWPNRLRPWESGVNLDAILFALSGVRYAAVPNWDVDDIRLEPRIPHGASYLTFKRIDKDERRLDLYANDVMQRLSAKEREDNSYAPPDRRRDEDVEHRRLRCRVELTSEDPPKGYWDLALTVFHTRFVRFLTADGPTDEFGFWDADQDNAFWPTTDAAPAATWQAPADGDEKPLLLLTARQTAADLARGQATIVDTGLPLRAVDVAALLLTADGTPRHATLLLDRGWDRSDRTTFKPAGFWQDPAWTTALERFTAAGGTVLGPGYFETYELRRGEQWEPGAIAIDGRLEILTDGKGATVRTAVQADAAREAVLRLGSGCSLDVTLNGAPVWQRVGARLPQPDTDSVLIALRPGPNVLEFHLSGAGPAVLFARVTDAYGVPIDVGR